MAKTKTATFNDSVKEATILVLDGNNGQEVQSFSGVLPDQTPYQFMFAKPDVIISISPGAVENGRVASANIGSQISIITIPEKYRQ